MWELDYKESWVPKNWCLWTVVLEKTLESPLDGKEIQPVHPKRNESWIFIGRIDAEAEAPVLWPADGKSWLIRKDPDAGRDCEQEEKGTTEDEMVAWHHWLDGREFEQALGVAEGQGSLACCSPGDCKESEITDQLNGQPVPHREPAWLSRSAVGGLQMVLLCIHPPVAFSLPSYQKGCIVGYTSRIDKHSSPKPETKGLCQLP